MFIDYNTHFALNNKLPTAHTHTQCSTFFFLLLLSIRQLKLFRLNEGKNVVVHQTIKCINFRSVLQCQHKYSRWHKHNAYKNDFSEEKKRRKNGHFNKLRDFEVASLSVETRKKTRHQNKKIKRKKKSLKTHSCNYFDCFDAAKKLWLK